MKVNLLIVEAHHITHIERILLILEEEPEQRLIGFDIADTNPKDLRDLLNYRKAFEISR
jgi:hypothetical protein